MKKTLFILLLVALVGSFAFAEELTVEQRLDALEAAPAITASGSVTFGLGANFDTDGTNLPLATSSKTAKASIKLSSADEKVTADLDMNLLAVPSVKVTLDNTDNWLDAIYGTTSHYDDPIPSVKGYNEVSVYVDFWNAHAEDTTPTGEADVFTTAQRTTLINAIDGAYNNGTLVRTDADASDAPAIDLRALVQKDADADTEIVFADGDTVTDSSVQGALDTIIVAGAAKLLDDAADATIQGWTPADYDALVTLLNAQDKTEISTWNDQDRKAVSAALALLKAWRDVDGGYNFDMTATVTQNFFTAASITLHGVGDVADVKMNFGGQHIKAGAIALDGSGHTKSSVKAYPSVAMTLNSGVVEGLSAGAEFFFDDNAAMKKNALITDLSDDVYTWMDEEVKHVDPKLGYSVNAGYDLVLSDDMKVGFSGSVAQYDFLAAAAADKVLGYTVGASFAGMGADVSAELDSGLGMMYGAADLAYTVAGFTPYFSFDYISLDADGTYNLVYAKTPASVMASLKVNGGMVLGGGVKADLESYIGMPASLSGGAEYGMYKDTTVDSVLAWNAALSVTPIDALVVSAGANADAVLSADVMGWNAGAAYTMSDDLGFSASIANAYNTTKKDASMTWNVGATYTYGSAVIAAKVGTAYDKGEGSETVQYSINTTVKF